MKTIRTALIQSKVGKNRSENLDNARKLIDQATNLGARLISLPECFNSPYGTKFFNEYAESVPNGPTSEMLSKAAKENQIYLVGGTFPEIENNKFYNTCTVWGPEGNLLAKYRKMHLFDIDIPGGITFKESDVLSPGDELAMFEIDRVKVGLGICYDLRFEELAKLYRLKGAEILIYPAAFNLTTGPLHFELLQRARAIDNQVFVLGISPARGDQGYIAYGHSQITSPWGKVIGQAKEGEQIIQVDLDLNECDQVRQQIPIYSQRRTDIYNTVQV